MAAIIDYRESASSGQCYASSPLSSDGAGRLRRAIRQALGTNGIRACGIAVLGVGLACMPVKSIAAGGDGTEGFVILGADNKDKSGASVASAGDINGDGIDDLLIGAPFASRDGKVDLGTSYVVFGRTTGFAATFDLRVLYPAFGGDGSAGFVLKGINRQDALGGSVSGGGDVNGDGIDDLIVGARNGDPNNEIDAGESYVVFGRAEGFPAVLELSDLLPFEGGDGTKGFVIKGVDMSDHSGRVVSSAGDLNADGFADLIVGADDADPLGLENAGESYVLFGHAEGFPPVFELRSLFPQLGGDGSDGFVLRGVDMHDDAGSSLSGLADVNGDGIDDLIIGAPNGDPGGDSFAGESYVVYGRMSGFPATFELRSLFPVAGGDGSSGAVLKGVDAGDRSGWSLSDVGDVNGDGISDLIVGAYDASPNSQSDAGESYVVFGRETGFGATLELSTLFPGEGGDGTDGFVIQGIDTDDNSGFSVSGVGDLNGDNVDDLAIGAIYGAGLAGEAYVVFGRSTGFPAAFDLANLLPAAGGDGSEGFVLSGIDPFDSTGVSLSGAGDINGDGMDDLVIGAAGADPGGRIGAGETYVIFGRTDGFPSVFELSSLLP